MDLKNNSVVGTDEIKTVVGNVIEISIDSVMSNQADGLKTVGTETVPFIETMMSGAKNESVLHDSNSEGSPPDE